MFLSRKGASMDRREMSFTQRKERIMEIAGTHYCSSGSPAADYLSAIEGASIEDQKRLFAIVLTVHGSRWHKERVCRCDSLSRAFLQERQAVQKRLSSMVTSWLECMVNDNAPVEEAAGVLWDNITLVEGDDKRVALDMVLSSNVIPYAQTKGSLLLLEQVDFYEQAHDRILDKVALFKKLRMSGLSALQLSAATVRMMAEMASDEERTAFMADVWMEVSYALNSRGNAREALLGLLLLKSILGDEEEGEEE